MPELARAQSEEFVSPRFLILGLCFIWGVGVGFALNFFRTPEPDVAPPTQAAPPSQPRRDTAAALNDLDRRADEAPAIAVVEPAAVPLQSDRSGFENMDIAPPAVLISPEIGLNGLTARERRSQPAAPPGMPVQSYPGVPPPPPLIPDLDP